MMTNEQVQTLLFIYSTRLVQMRKYGQALQEKESEELDTAMVNLANEMMNKGLEITRDTLE